MDGLRALWRLPWLIGHVLLGAVITLSLAAVRGMGFKGPDFPPIVQWWQRRLCGLLGLRLRMTGTAGDGPALVVSNHISWLDIPALAALQPLSFLSKAEVRDWPLVGWMAAFAGTLFIERGNHQADLIREQIRRRLDQGDKVVFFPEGTTTDGGGVRRFHPRLFAAVQEAGVPLQPVALRYRAAPGRPEVAPFIDDDTLPAHLRRVLGEPWIEVEVIFSEPLEPGGLDRRGLAEQARNSIVQSLGL